MTSPQAQEETKPSPQVQAILDRLMAGNVTEEFIAAEIQNDIYGGLREYCSIPAGYEHCKLATKMIDIEHLDIDEMDELLEFPPGEIVNPHKAHKEGIEFFKMLSEGNRLVCKGGNPLYPEVGAFCYGPPGTGKTHIVVAYAIQLHASYQKHLSMIEGEVATVVKDLYEKFINTAGAATQLQQGIGKYSLDESGFVESSPVMDFHRGIQRLKDRIAGWPVKPTDFLYLDFDQLVEFYESESERPEVIAAISNAQVVFVDDVHPKNDPKRAQVIQHIIERRYNAGKPATFLTSNLDISELGGGDKKIGQRLVSRCKEMLFTVDFKDCVDWRTTVKAKKITMVREVIAERLALESNSAASE